MESKVPQETRYALKLLQTSTLSVFNTSGSSRTPRRTWHPWTGGREGVLQTHVCNDSSTLIVVVFLNREMLVNLVMMGHLATQGPPGILVREAILEERDHKDLR